MSDDLMSELDELDAITTDSPDANAAQANVSTTERKVSAKRVAAVEESAGEIVIVNPLEGEGQLHEILDFDDLDLALKSQASLFAYYSEAAARAQMQHNRAKQNVEQVTAKMNHVVREKLANEGGKVTEKAIETKVALTKAVQNAQHCLNDAQYIYKLCNSVVEAFHQREQMIIQTCKRAEMEMMMKGSYSGKHGTREDRDNMMRDALKTKSTAND
jgi:hypothetical protein